MFRFNRIYHRIELNFWAVVIPLMKDSALFQHSVYRLYPLILQYQELPGRKKADLRDWIVFSSSGLFLGMLTAVLLVYLASF